MDVPEQANFNTRQNDGSHNWSLQVCPALFPIAMKTGTIVFHWHEDAEHDFHQSTRKSHATSVQLNSERPSTKYLGSKSSLCACLLPCILRNVCHWILCCYVFRRAALLQKPLGSYCFSSLSFAGGSVWKHVRLLAFPTLDTSYLTIVDVSHIPSSCSVAFTSSRALTLL